MFQGLEFQLCWRSWPSSPIPNRAPEASDQANQNCGSMPSPHPNIKSCVQCPAGHGQTIYTALSAFLVPYTVSPMTGIPLLGMFNGIIGFRDGIELQNC